MTSFFIGIAMCTQFAVLPAVDNITTEELRYTIEQVLSKSPRPELNSPEAVELLLLTHAAESIILGKAYRYQMNSGPAQGLFQMEPETEKDTWQHFLSFPANKDLKQWVLSYASSAKPHLKDKQAPRDLIYNTAYQIAIARIYYYRRGGRIPKQLKAQADFWKKHYNTYLGVGKQEVAIAKYNQFILGKP